MKLKLDHTQESVGKALGISSKRESELTQIFLETVLNIFENDHVSLSHLIKEVSELDITIEEYTYMILQLGVSMVGKSHKEDSHETGTE